MLQLLQHGCEWVQIRHKWTKAIWSQYLQCILTDIRLGYFLTTIIIKVIITYPIRMPVHVLTKNSRSRVTLPQLQSPLISTLKKKVTGADPSEPTITHTSPIYMVSSGQSMALLNHNVDHMITNPNGYVTSIIGSFGKSIPNMQSTITYTTQMSNRIINGSQM